MGKTAQLGVPDTFDSRMMLWNVETWKWEAATKGSGIGTEVSVDNFLP